ncbi:hypothetical protein ID866_11215 [Astraeus odoratus]|nr:hypothetical protein ID866_11215 [Astraeus odoratus]
MEMPEMYGKEWSMTGCEVVYNHVSEDSDPLDLAEFASALPSPVDASNPNAEERKLTLEWLKEDVVAKDILCRCLSLSVLHLIPQEWSSTACDTWATQHAVHEKLLSLQMAGEKDAECYLGEHDALQHNLICMGTTYTDEEAIFNLLKGLPCTRTWPAFKLLLQSSIHTTVTTSLGSTVSTTSLSASVPKSSLGQSSSITALLSTAGTTFEAVSVRIAAEAHHLLLESTSAAPVGSECANVAQPLHRDINPATGLR